MASFKSLYAGFEAWLKRAEGMAPAIESEGLAVLGVAQTAVSLAPGLGLTGEALIAANAIQKGIGMAETFLHNAQNKKLTATGIVLDGLSVVNASPDVQNAVSTAIDTAVAAANALSVLVAAVKPVAAPPAA